MSGSQPSRGSTRPSSNPEQRQSTVVHPRGAQHAQAPSSSTIHRGDHRQCGHRRPASSTPGVDGNRQTSDVDNNNNNNNNNGDNGNDGRARYGPGWVVFDGILHYLGSDDQYHPHGRDNHSPAGSEGDRAPRSDGNDGANDPNHILNNHGGQSWEEVSVEGSMRPIQGSAYESSNTSNPETTYSLDGRYQYVHNEFVYGPSPWSPEGVQPHGDGVVSPDQTNQDFAYIGYNEVRESQSGYPPSISLHEEDEET